MDIDFRISFIATAVPERVLPILYTVINPKAETMVFIAPTKNKKERLSCSNISELIVAAWPEPMPGRKEHNGADIAAAKKDFESCFFVNFISFSFEILCLLMLLALFFRETIKADEPNKPVRRGRRGSFIGRLRVTRPRKPARINIVIEEMKLSSLNIKNSEMKIRRKGIRGIIIGYKIGNIKI